MKVAVWDTYVEKEDGKIMHFDIFVPDTEKDREKIFAFGKEYLSGKPFKTSQISSRECNYCHVEHVPQHMADTILKEGYYIYELENCQ